MANVFLSYAREDRARAASIAQALSARGWNVWWDRTIPPGKTFDDVIEDALDRAGCVVVLWSKASTSSHWVRSEAAEGIRRGILVPALLEEVKIPLEFRRVQSANLTSWDGTPGHTDFEQFIESIATLLIAPAVPAGAALAGTATPAGAASPRPVEPRSDSFVHTRQPLPTPRRRPHVITWTIALVVVVAAAAGLAFWISPSLRSSLLGNEPPIDDAPAVTPSEPRISPAVPADPRTEVPSLVGRSLVEARAQLERLGLRVGAINETSEAGAAGTIRAQRPAAGETVSGDTPIDLVIVAAAKPKGPPLTPNPKREPPAAPDAEVPTLTGLALEVAQDRLARRGFVVGQVRVQPAAKSEADVVVAQDPSAGTRQPRGTAVSLAIGGPASGTGDPSGGGRSPGPNAITNIRVTERSASEVVFDADVFYNGVSGSDRIYLTVSITNGKTPMRGTLTRTAQLRVGANKASVTASMSGAVAEATSTEASLCIRAMVPLGQQRPEPSVIHCQQVPLAKSWVLPMNKVTSFRAANVSPAELRVSVALWYDGSLGNSRISLQACPRGSDRRTRVAGIRCGQAALQEGPNRVELTMTRERDSQATESAAVEVCLVGPRYFECQVYTHQRQWMPVP